MFKKRNRALDGTVVHEAIGYLVVGSEFQVAVDGRVDRPIIHELERSHVVGACR